MAFCTECGANIPDGVRFCTSCGAPFEPSPPASVGATAGGYTNTVSPIPQPVFSQTQAPPYGASAPPVSNMYNGEVPPKSGGRYAVMGTGAYIGYSILFSIPLVGFIFCIITACTATNLNKRNFARAMMVFMIIGIILSIAVYLVVSWVFEAVSMYIGTDILDILNSAG